MNNRFELFATTISQLYKYLQKIKSFEMTEFDLKGTHVMCIFELCHHPDGLSVTQLSTLCEQDKAAISRTISELKEKGLITSKSDKKYRAPLVLTEDGKKVASYIDKRAEDAVNAGSINMNKKEREKFYKTLTAISENLKNYLNDIEKEE